MEITTQRLTLRDILETDTNAIYSYRSLPEVARYQYWKPYTLDDAINFARTCSRPVKDGEWMGLAIIQNSTGEFIGDCAFKVEATSAEIGCNIAPIHQNKGCAKEVLRALINYCLENLQLEEVFGITDAENVASIKLMESVGMKNVADSEEEIECKGAWCAEEKYRIGREN